MNRKEIMRAVVHAVGEFNGRRLWDRFGNSDCFAVTIAGQDEPMLGVILGGGGDEYGLSLFRGPGAAVLFAAMSDPAGPGDDVSADMDLLGFTMDVFRNLTPDAQSLLKEAGQHPQPDERVPWFLAKPRGRQVRTPDERERDLLLRALLAVVDADKQKALCPARLTDPKGICILAVSGDPAAGKVAVTRQPWPWHEAPQVVSVLGADSALASLPRLNATWLIGTPSTPDGIEGDDRSMQLLLIVDDKTGSVIQGLPLFAGQTQEAVDGVMGAFVGHGLHGHRGVPRKIIWSSARLLRALSPILVRAGVTCAYRPMIDKIGHVVRDYIAYREAPSGIDRMDVPSAHDLAGWKEVHARLIRGLEAYLETGDRPRSSRAVKRYFDDENRAYYFEKHREQAVAQAYTGWCLLDYLPTRGSKTDAEKMLAEGLPAPVALLLRAMMEACPTLYRVAAHDPKAGTLDLEDVLLGGMTTVNDRAMSQNVEAGLFFPARVFRAGGFHFIHPAGPPLGPGTGMAAVEFLQQCGVEFTREGLLRDAHKLGWLWQWSDLREDGRRPPDLRNMDGDELLLHTASFSVADPDRTCQALRNRQDIECDGQEGEFIWIARTGRAARTFGGPVTLGRIELVGDELILSVNSARRFSGARRWLGGLPGVTFRDVTTRRWDEDEQDRPLDERISPPEPVAITPEIAAAVQDLMDKQYMRWLDTPLPVLGGRTPRQACESDAGREKVAVMIRAIPDPSGPGSVRVPRQAMRRELGLAVEPSAPAPPAPWASASESVPDAPSDEKVGRNDPCPCGSGKKYKRCCGGEEGLE